MSRHNRLTGYREGNAWDTSALQKSDQEHGNPIVSVP
jgi:hypothetical protein